MANNPTRKSGKRGYSFTLSILLLAATVIVLAMYAAEWRRSAQAASAAIAQPVEASRIQGLVGSGLSSIIGASAQISKNSTNVAIKISTTLPLSQVRNSIADYSAAINPMLAGPTPYEAVVTSSGSNLSNRTAIFLPDSGSLSLSSTGYSDNAIYLHPVPSNVWKPTAITASIFCNRSLQSNSSLLVSGAGSGSINYTVIYNDSGGHSVIQSSLGNTGPANFSVTFPDAAQLAFSSDLSSGAPYTSLNYTTNGGVVFYMPFDVNVSYNTSTGAIQQPVPDVSPYHSNGILEREVYGGSCNGAPIWVDTGVYGGSYYFQQLFCSGYGDVYGEINASDPASGVLDFGTSDFSVSVWAFSPKPRVGGLGDYWIVAKQKSTGQQMGWALFYTSESNTPLSKFAYYSFMLGNKTACTNGNCQCPIFNVNLSDVFNATVTKGGWDFVTVTVNRTGNVTMYLNGKEAKPWVDGFNDISSYQSCSVSNSLPLTMGYPSQAVASTATLFFVGYMDEVRLYNRVLSAGEVISLYDGQYQVPCYANLTFTYDGAGLNNRQLTAYYNANVKVRTLSPDAILDMHFDQNVSSTDPNAVADYSSSHIEGITLGGGDPTKVPAWVSSGVSGGAYSFDGANDYISLGSDTLGAALNGSSGATVSAWINPKSYPASSVVYIQGSQSGGTASGGVELGIKNSRLFAASRSTQTDAYSSLSAISTPPLNGWTHVAAVFDYANKKMSIYLNGTLDNSTTGVSFGLNYYNDSMYNSTVSGDDQIGNGSGSFNGQIDEVRVFSRALGAQEIYSLYKDSALAYDGPVIASSD